jgi:hypothetical protein
VGWGVGLKPMKKYFAAGVIAASSAVLAFSTVASAASLGLNTPAPGGKVHVAGATNISGWAVVDTDATLVRKENAKSAAKLGTGSYEVVFNSALNHCSYQASAATPGISGAPVGLIGLSPRSGNNRAVFIQTRDTSGNLIDLAFHLQVTCS